MLQLEKYKKHYLLLTQKGGLDMSEMSYDYLSAWCAKEMDTVFGKGWAVSRLSLKAAFDYVISGTFSTSRQCTMSTPSAWATDCGPPQLCTVGLPWMASRSITESRAGSWRGYSSGTSIYFYRIFFCFYFLIYSANM